MSTARRQIDAPPERVWAVLADPDSYAHWVVGSRDTRSADPGFPAKGTSFHHTVAFGPIDLRDETEVVESDAPRRLVCTSRRDRSAAPRSASTSPPPAAAPT